MAWWGCTHGVSGHVLGIVAYAVPTIHRDGPWFSGLPCCSVASCAATSILLALDGPNQWNLPTEAIDSGTPPRENKQRRLSQHQATGCQVNCWTSSQPKRFIDRYYIWYTYHLQLLTFSFIPPSTCEQRSTSRVILSGCPGVRLPHPTTSTGLLLPGTR